MNLANAYNEDGQRILPERLYSPFIRMPIVDKPRRKKPAAPKQKMNVWPIAIREALADQPMTFKQLYAKLSHIGTRKGCETACARMHARFEIVYEGKHKSSIYKLTK